MKDIDFEKVLIRVCAEQQTMIDELRQEFIQMFNEPWSIQ